MEGHLNMPDLPGIPDPAGWVRHLRDEHARIDHPVASCRKDRQNWPCDTIRGLDMAAAAERERIAALADKRHAVYAAGWPGCCCPEHRKPFADLIRNPEGAQS